MEIDNVMNIKCKALNVNESFLRSAVAGFCSYLNPTLSEISDIKTAVSEAITNVIVHAYPNEIGYVEINVEIDKDTMYIKVIDNGIGINDIKLARQPFYTSKPDTERSGIGFTVMEGFMDSVDVQSVLGGGTTITMTKTISKKADNQLIGG